MLQRSKTLYEIFASAGIAFIMGMFGYAMLSSASEIYRDKQNGAFIRTIATIGAIVFGLFWISIPIFFVWHDHLGTTFGLIVIGAFILLVANAR